MTPELSTERSRSKSYILNNYLCGAKELRYAAIVALSKQCLSLFFKYDQLQS